MMIDSQNFMIKNTSHEKHFVHLNSFAFRLKGKIIVVWTGGNVESGAVAKVIQHHSLKFSMLCFHHFYMFTLRRKIFTSFWSA